MDDTRILLISALLAFVLPVLQSIVADDKAKARLGDMMAVLIGFITPVLANGDVDPELSALLAAVVKWGSQASYDGFWAHKGLNTRMAATLGRTAGFSFDTDEPGH